MLRDDACTIIDAVLNQDADGITDMLVLFERCWEEASRRQLAVALLESYNSILVVEAGSPASPSESAKTVDFQVKRNGIALVEARQELEGTEALIAEAKM